MFPLRESLTAQILILQPRKIRWKPKAEMNLAGPLGKYSQQDKMFAQWTMPSCLQFGLTNDFPKKLWVPSSCWDACNSLQTGIEPFCWAEIPDGAGRSDGNVPSVCSWESNTSSNLEFAPIALKTLHLKCRKQLK